MAKKKADRTSDASRTAVAEMDAPPAIPTDLPAAASDQIPTPPIIGDRVHYFERSRFVLARERGIDPVPTAAIVTRVNLDKTGQFAGLLGLTVFDPELGPLPKRDVPYSEEPAPEKWTHAPGVQSVGRVAVQVSSLVPTLKQLVDAAVDERLEALERRVETLSEGTGAWKNER